MPGGEVAIEVRPDWSFRLGGDVAVFTGMLSAEFFENAGRLDRR